MINFVTVGQFEAWLKEGLIQIHKEATGRGPKEAHVRLFKKTIVFYLEETLTRLEQRLFDLGWGEKGINHIRTDLMEFIMPQIQEKIREKARVEILDTTTIVLPDQQAQYGLIILDRDIEKMYNNV